MISFSYDENYYNTYNGQPYVRNDIWMDFFNSVAKNIKDTLNPHTVMDAGCAKGFLVEALWLQHIKAYGRDISEYAINNVYWLYKNNCEVRSLTEPYDKCYDLITCIEVLEHIPAQKAKLSIKNMCNATDTILFSSTYEDVTTPSHINVHMPDYWIKAFGKYGFYYDIDYNANFVTHWAMLFRKDNETNTQNKSLS